jgi:hypothetical protein
MTETDSAEIHRVLWGGREWLVAQSRRGEEDALSRQPQCTDRLSASCAYMEVLQQTASAVPPPIHPIGEMRSLLQENGRPRAPASWWECQHVDRDFLLISDNRYGGGSSCTLTAFCAANTQFINPT